MRILLDECLPKDRLIHVNPFAPEILERAHEFKPGHVYVLAV
jgi:hypothetical protein